MTKKVRIENADTSSHRLVVETWRKGADGQPDVLAETKELNNPADLAECWVWGGQYLVVREATP